MERSISVMVGKGSVNHNSRIFHAKNTDPVCSHLNHSYCNIPIKQVYHELFDDAVKRYNKKQTRKDRQIKDYYEKIQSGNQEKPFHEIILQIGNHKDMNAKTEDGQLAAKVLDKYIQGFPGRNPNLRVFSAHLHMDESTPHLHIDFIPFTTGSKRGLDTRISLKQALMAQGFKGGTKQETEWNQWVSSEKEQLASVMQRYGIEWNKLGTNEKHLTLLNYEKQERAKEVAALEAEISEKKSALDSLESSISDLQSKFETYKNKVTFIEDNTRKFEVDPEWQLPKPATLMSAKNYHEKIAVPFVQKLRKLIVAILTEYFDAVKSLNSALTKARNQIWNLSDSLNKYKTENERLKGVEKNFDRLRKFFNGDEADKIIQEVAAQEKMESKNLLQAKGRKQTNER